jgi:hypothetical protein
MAGGLLVLPNIGMVLRSDKKLDGLSPNFSSQSGNGIVRYGVPRTGSEPSFAIHSFAIRAKHLFTREALYPGFPPPEAAFFRSTIKI